MRALLIVPLLAAAAAAKAPERPDPDTVRRGLAAPDREAREQAYRVAKTWARTDPAGVAQLWDRLDTTGRCAVVRALAAAGTNHAAGLALKKAATADHTVFRALLGGLVEGGEKAMRIPLPDAMPPARRATLEALRLRWRVEEEMARLKSPWGQTGHYAGQYDGLRKLGPDIVPILIDMLLDRAHPLPGEGAAGPYQSIHPWMVRFEPGELRSLAGYSFGEVVSRDNRAAIESLTRLFERYWEMTGESIERDDLAPVLAYSLHDLGVPWPARDYIGYLERRARERWGRGPSQRALQAWWDLGFAYIRIGEPDKGEKRYQSLLEEPGASKAIAAYNLACNFAMRAAREPRFRDDYVRRAIRYLELAIKSYKYTDWGWMEEDKDLSFIRGHPRYKSLLKYLKTKYPARLKGRIPKELEDFLAGSRHDPDED